MSSLSSLGGDRFLPSQGELDLLKSMQERLTILLKDKGATQKEIASLDEKLQDGYKLQGQRPKETEQDIEKAMKDLEFKMQTESMSLQAEKKLLRKMDDYKKQKIRIKSYRANEEEFQDLKQRKTQLYEAMKAKETTISELNQGIRKLQLAHRVGVAPEELINITVEIPENCVSRVIGKGGSNLRRIEETCKVSIDMDQSKAIARISGGEAACDLAKQKIEEVTHSVSEDIPVSEAMIQTLLLQKASLTQTLMNEHNLRVEVFKAEGMIRASGLPENILALKESLAGYKVASQRVPLDVKLIAAVVGKGGSNFKRLEEEYGVSIDADRDGGAIVISGFTEQTVGAAEEIQKLIDNYEDREWKLPIDRFTSRLLKDQEGKMMKELRKTTGCLLFVDIKKDDEEGFVAIKGHSYKIHEAVAETKRFLAEIQVNCIEVPIDQEMVKYVIGKKGAVINKLREKTGAMVDTDMTTGIIRIYADEEGKREAAKEEILQIVEKNQVSEVTISREAAICLKSNKGQEMRDKCNKLEVQMDIIGDSGSIRLRGPVENMDQVKELLHQFAEENYGVEMDLPPDDYATLVSGGENSLKKEVQDSTGATLFTLKEEGLLKIRGSREAVAAAEAAVRKVLDGGEGDGSAALVPVHPDVIPPLIGKSGASINRFREEHGVDLIVLKVRSQIRVRGDPAKVAPATEALRKYLAELKTTFPVTASKSTIEALESSKELAAFKAQYDVGLERTSDGFRIRGVVSEAVEARDRLKELVTKRAKVSINVSPSQLSTVTTSASDSHWKKIRSDFAVSVDVDKANHAIVIQGAAPAVSRAKGYLFSMLEVLLAGQFAHVAIPSETIPSLATAAAMSKLKEGTGIEQVWLDRVKGFVRVRGPVEAVAKVKDAVDRHVTSWAQRNVSVPFEAWMLPLIIGKSGANIKDLQKTTNVTVDVDRDNLVAKLSGEPDDVKKARELIAEKIDVIRRENAEMEVPSEVLSSLIGKKGANLTKIREETGATIDVANDGKGVIRLRGSEDSIAKARTAIETFVSGWMKSNVVKEVPVHVDQIRLIVGVKGGIIKLITEESGAKIDLDRDNSKVVIRGGAEAVESASVLIQRIVDEDNATNATARAEREQREREQREAASTKVAATREALPLEKDNAKGSPTTHTMQADAVAHAQPEWNFPQVPPGADATMARQLMEKAAKKKKKKEKKEAAKQGQGQGGTRVASPPVEAIEKGVASLTVSVSPSPPPPGLVVEGESGKKGGSKVEEEGVGGGKKKIGSKGGASVSHHEGNGHVKEGGEKGGGEKQQQHKTKKEKVKEDVHAAAREVVKTSKANELLDLILGTNEGPSVSSTASEAHHAEGESSSSSSGAISASNKSGGGKYFKSSSGFSIRL